MKIILLQDVKNLGQQGDIKDVAEGYAQNFLLPKKMAQVATESAVKNIQLQKEKEASQKMTAKQELEKLANQLKNKKIVILAKEKGGKLFGSISAKQISAELQKENLNISPVSVIIKEAIKKTGEYEIKIKLTEDIQTKIILEVKGN